jgi:hypothetical protein
MRKFKRNTIIIAWVYAIMIATGCFIFFYVRGTVLKQDYERALFITLYISVCTGSISGMIHRFVGNRIAKERKNWDDVINELSFDEITDREVVFLMSYIVFALSLAVFVPVYLILIWGPQLGF